MGISTYARVNNFRSSCPDEVHFEQRMISPPSFAAVLLSFKRRFAFARQPKQRPDAPRSLANPNPNGPIHIDETMSASSLLRHSLQYPPMTTLDAERPFASWTMNERCTPDCGHRRPAYPRRRGEALFRDNGCVETRTGTRGVE